MLHDCGTVVGIFVKPNPYESRPSQTNYENPMSVKYAAKVSY